MKKLLLLSILVLPLFGADPDCKFSYRLTNIPGESTDGISVFAISSGAVNTIAINNINSGCSAWSFQYSSSGLTAESISLQSAPDIGGTTPTPGTFTTFAGTTVAGSNPSTATTSSLYTATGYYPFLRIALGSSTGTGGINIVLNGWKSPAYVSANSSGGGGVSGIAPGTNVTVNGSTSATCTSGTCTIAASGGTGAPLATTPSVSVNVSQSPYYMSGSAQTTTLASGASASSTTVSLSSAIDFIAGQGIYIAGAGPSTGVGGTITYSSGITATGTGTCFLTSTNGGGQGASATVAITSGSVGSSLTIIATGIGYTSVPTTWTATAGFTTTSVTCSGTATTTGGNVTTATNYVGTVSSISGTTFTISPAISTTVSSGAVVQHDESIAFNNLLVNYENIGVDAFMPIGVYNMNNCWAGSNNSVITFPNIAATGDPSQLSAIYIHGGNSMLGNMVGTSGQLGTIIQTSCKSGSLINSPTGIGGNGWLAFTPEFANITFSTYQNPGITVLDTSSMNQSKLRNVQFIVGATGSIPNQPINPNGRAYINSGPNNLDINIVEDTLVYGYYSALTLGAHTFAKNIYTFYNWNCVVVNNSGDHPVTIETIDAERCGRVFSPNGVGQQSYLHVMHLDVENTTDLWPGTVIDCYDPNNNFTGLIIYGNDTANPWTQTGCQQLNHATYPSFIEGGLNTQNNSSALGPVSAINCGTGLACSVSLVNSREVFKIENPSAVQFVNTIAAGAGAGTGPTVSVSGGITTGTVSITTGTTPSASAVVATVSYQYADTVYGAPKGCLLFPTNANAALASSVAPVYTGTPSTTGWTINSGATALTSATTYTWTYICGQAGGN